MDAFNFDNTKSSLWVRSHKYFLIVLEFAFVNYSSDNNVFIRFIEFLLYVEFTTVWLIHDVCFTIGKLQIVEKVFEQVDTLMSLIADAEYWTHDLTLHLSINQNYVLFVVDNISNFLAYFPHLCP